MEMTVYNPKKGRLETIDTVLTDENTTWFDNCAQGHEIYMITDFEGDLLIRELGVCLSAKDLQHPRHLPQVLRDLHSAQQARHRDDG
jgi:hypothetical protein